MKSQLACLRNVISELSDIKDDSCITVIHLERGEPDFIGNHLVTMTITYAVGGNGKPVGPSKDVGGCDFE